jgi:hypothetical protein
MGSGLLEGCRIRVVVACPGDHAVGPDEYGPEPEVVARRSGRVPDPARPARGGAVQAPAGAEVERDASPVLQQVAEAGAVLQTKVRGCPAARRRIR